MKRLALLALLLATPAAADSFGGVAGNEKSYVIGREKVCQPLAVSGASARGVPSCRAADTDELAALSLKSPTPERGGGAEVRATAKGQTLTITRKDGTAVVTWTAVDPIASVVDVWRSTYGRIIVVEYTVRRAGREVHEVVGFDVGVGGKEPTAPTTVTPPPTTVDAPPAVDPAVEKLAAKARKTSGKAAFAAWNKVLAADPDNAEAHYRIAAAYAATKTPLSALSSLESLSKSPRPDAAEWLIEARFDKSFLKLVDNTDFRSVVGLDRAPSSTYERLMGMGGQWEQSVIPCDRPEIKLTLRRARTFKLELSSVCSGMRERLSWTGTWSHTTTQTLELRLKKPKGGFDAAPCTLTRDADEDVLTCHLDADLAFEARPVRR
jgi:hypothetical protein